MSDTQSQTVNSSLFTEIPYGLLVPGTYVQVKPIYSDAGLLPFPARILLVAQMLAAGTAVPYQIYPLLTPQQATNLCGAGSIGERQAIAALAQNPFISIDIMCVPDATGSAAAVGSFQFTASPPTENGVVALYIGDIEIQVPVLAGQTSAEIVAAAVTQINAQVNPTVPVVATVTGTTMRTITLTFRHGGAEGNTLNLECCTGPGDVLPAGLVAPTITPMTGGTLNPSVAQVIDDIGNLWYTDIITPWADNVNASALAAEYARRYTATVGQDAFGYMCLTGSYGAIQSAELTLNSQFMGTMGLQGALSPHWAWSASIGVGCAISLYNDPARQCKGIVLPGIVGPRQANQFPPNERQLLLAAGISTFNVLSDGTVVIERMVTQNLTDNTGTATTAWQDINAPRVATRIRYDWKGYVNLTYPNNKLADDGSLAAEYDPTIATPNRLKGSWAARCNVYGKQGWIEDIQNQVRASVFVRDPNNRNNVLATQPYLRIGNLFTLSAMLQFQA